MDRISAGADADLDWAGIPELIRLRRNSDDLTLRSSFAEVWRHPGWRRVLFAGIGTLIVGLIPGVPSVVILLGYTLFLVAWIEGCALFRAIGRPIFILSPTPEPDSQQVQLIGVSRPSKVRKPCIIVGILCLIPSVGYQFGPDVKSVGLVLFLTSMGTAIITLRSPAYHLVTYHGNPVPWRNIEPVVRALKKVQRRGYILEEAIPRAIKVATVLVRARGTNDIIRIRLLEWPTLGYVRGQRLRGIGRRLRKPSGVIVTALLFPVVVAIVLKATHLN